MTVKELMAKLAKLPPNATILAVEEQESGTAYQTLEKVSFVAEINSWVIWTQKNEQ